MASVFEQLQVKYQGFTSTENFQGKQTTIIFIGSKALCKEAYDELYRVGSVMPGYEEYGPISTLEISPDEGAFWLLKITFEPISSAGGAESTGDAAQQIEISISELTRPIETLDNYRLIWNHNLYTTLDPNTASVPFDYEEAIPSADMIPLDCRYPSYSRIAPDGYVKGFWCWAKDVNSCTPLPQGYTWYKKESMTKVGVDHYTVPTYTVTFTGTYKKLNLTKWVTRYTAGTVYEKLPNLCPMANSFIRHLNSLWTSWTWLCQGNTVVYTKQGWNVSLVFTRSATPAGWDEDLYGEPQEVSSGIGGSGFGPDGEMPDGEMPEGNPL